MVVSDPDPPDWQSCVGFTNDFLPAFRSCRSEADIIRLMESLSQAIDCSYFALIHHDDLRGAPPNRVNIKHYPQAVADRIIGQCQFRRDPVVRGCLFADSAFLWSDLSRIITISRQDRLCFEQGLRAGLNEGITVPYMVLGQCAGSCTFAGMRRPERAAQFLGVAQMLGIFAFQAAKRVIGYIPEPARCPRLHPRPRDCVVLAGRGLSNKEIARALELTPRTVDGYLTEARRLFEAHDRTELVVSAVLAGEVDLHELRRQPE